MTQNDPVVAVALTRAVRYSLAHDKIFSRLQNPDNCGFGVHSCNESASVREPRVSPPHGQARASRRLWVSGRVGPIWLAKALGPDDFCGTGPLWNRDRAGSTLHGHWPNRLSRRYSRKYVGRGARPHHFSYFLDTTPPLKRRFPCAA